MYNSFLNLYNKATEISIPKQNLPNQNISKSKPKWFTPELRKITREKCKEVKKVVKKQSLNLWSPELLSTKM